MYHLCSIVCNHVLVESRHFGLAVIAPSFFSLPFGITFKSTGHWKTIRFWRGVSASQCDRSLTMSLEWTRKEKKKEWEAIPKSCNTVCCYFSPVWMFIQKLFASMCYLFVSLCYLFGVHHWSVVTVVSWSSFHQNPAESWAGVFLSDLGQWVHVVTVPPTVREEGLQSDGMLPQMTATSHTQSLSAWRFLELFSIYFCSQPHRHNTIKAHAHLHREGGQNIGNMNIMESDIITNKPKK